MSLIKDLLEDKLSNFLEDHIPTPAVEAIADFIFNRNEVGVEDKLTAILDRLDQIDQNIIDLRKELKTQFADLSVLIIETSIKDEITNIYSDHLLMTGIMEGAKAEVGKELINESVMEKIQLSYNDLCQDIFQNVLGYIRNIDVHVIDILDGKRKKLLKENSDIRRYHVQLNWKIKEFLDIYGQALDLFSFASKKYSLDIAIKEVKDNFFKKIEDWANKYLYNNFHKLAVMLLDDYVRVIRVRAKFKSRNQSSLYLRELKLLPERSDRPKYLICARKGRLGIREDSDFIISKGDRPSNGTYNVANGLILGFADSSFENQYPMTNWRSFKGSENTPPLAGLQIEGKRKAKWELQYCENKLKNKEEEQYVCFFDRAMKKYLLRSNTWKQSMDHNAFRTIQKLIAWLHKADQMHINNANLRMSELDVSRYGFFWEIRDKTTMNGKKVISDAEVTERTHDVAYLYLAERYLKRVFTVIS